MNSEWENIFAEAVNKAFDKYLKPLGYTLHQHDEGVFEAQSEYSSVEIELDRRIVVTEVKPAQKEQYEGVTLNVLLFVLATEVVKEKGLAWVSSDGILNWLDEVQYPEDLYNEVERQLDLLVTYCKPILLGDSSDWQKVEAYLNRDPSPEISPIIEQTHEQRISNLRSDAHEAYKHKDYTWTLTYLLVLQEEGERLTREEKRMLREAREWDEAYIKRR